VLILFWLVFSGPRRYSVDSLMRWGVSPASSVDEPMLREAPR
jgi:hypothetical protein